ncbi:MAG TPA: FkbM family methyltransferase [Urbifossiella sp.]|jgi:FkbM family methyltransferase|nr:FkbM family methyltransferase [Urbifossiella sp.]
MSVRSALESRAALERYCRGEVRSCPVEGTVSAVRVLGGPLVLVDTRDVLLCTHLAMDGFWESWVTLAVARHVRPGWRCVDVGASYGYYTLLLASLVGPAGRVRACEPNPDVARLLRTTVRLNGFDATVAVSEEVVADRTGEFHLSVPDFAIGGTMNGSVAAVYPGGRSHPVPGRPLADICGGEKIDFVKIDAEGGESAIWEGMGELRRANPGLTILMEFNRARYPSPAAFVARIRDAGYDLRHVETDGSLRPTPVPELEAGPAKDWMLWLARE